MGIATDAQMLSLMRKSPLFKKYAKTPGKSKTAYAPPPSVPGKKPAAMEAAEEAPGFLSFLGLLARKLIDFIGWVLDKLIKGILNFIGWLLHKLIFAPLIGIFHTLTFGIFRRRQHRRRR